MINVVTSCSWSGWHAYGRDCVDSFLKYWPQEVRLHLCSEDKIVEAPDHLVSVHDLLADRELREFLQRHQSDRRSQGYWNGLDYSTVYDYRFDAYRFCKKVFAVGMVQKLLGGGRLFWMDADCVTHAPVPIELLTRLPPDDYAVAYFKRPNYTECGFIGYNLDHFATRPFINEMVRQYSSDEYGREKEWHDSWVWDRVRERMDLNVWPIPVSMPTSHPLVFSELGKYMDHRKGIRRKTLPVSPEHPVFGIRKKK